MAVQQALSQAERAFAEELRKLDSQRQGAVERLKFASTPASVNLRSQGLISAVIGSRRVYVFDTQESCEKVVFSRGDTLFVNERDLRDYLKLQIPPGGTSTGRWSAVAPAKSNRPKSGKTPPLPELTPVTQRYSASEPNQSAPPKSGEVVAQPEVKKNRFRK